MNYREQLKAIRTKVANIQNVLNINPNASKEDLLDMFCWMENYSYELGSFDVNHWGNYKVNLRINELEKHFIEESKNCRLLLEELIGFCLDQLSFKLIDDNDNHQNIRRII